MRSNNSLTVDECKAMLKYGLAVAPTTSFLGSIMFASPVSLGKRTEVKECVFGHYFSMGKNSSAVFTRMGNYVTVGNHVLLNLGRHPIYEFSSSEAFCESTIFHNYPCSRETSVIRDNGGHSDHTYVGHDVTIGDGVISTTSIDIGHGAIIKAGSLLSHSVPPYAIVEGRNRIVGQRCNDEVISDLLELKWWNYDLPAAQKQGMLIPYNLADFVKWFKDTDLSAFKLSDKCRLLQLTKDKIRTGEFNLRMLFFKWEMVGEKNHPSALRASMLPEQ